MKLLTTLGSIHKRGFFVSASVITILLSVVYFDSYIYDVLVYHGPFSAIATNIPGLSDFKLDKFLSNRYQGFPPLWRFALFPSLALGLPRLMIIPNILSLTLLCWVVQRLKILPWYLTVCSIFIFPACLFSFRSGYQDFFVATMISSS